MAFEMRDGHAVGHVASAYGDAGVQVDDLGFVGEAEVAAHQGRAVVGSVCCCCPIPDVVQEVVLWDSASIAPDMGEFRLWACGRARQLVVMEKGAENRIH